MENLEILYREYVRLVERYNALLDSSFSDIRLYGVISAAIGLIGIVNKSDLGQQFFDTTIPDPDTVYFVIILFLFFLIAIIAFRDLLKQVYIVHTSYNIKKWKSA